MRNYQSPVSKLLLVSFLFALFSCATRFPDNPEAHRLYKELQQAPHPYYFMIERGIFSRIVGIQPEALMRALLSAVEARWSEIDRLDSSEALITYFRTVDLAPIAERIEETLSKNVENRPPEVNLFLEAAAIKQGLVVAAYEVKRERR